MNECEVNLAQPGRESILTFMDMRKEVSKKYSITDWGTIIALS